MEDQTLPLQPAIPDAGAAPVTPQHTALAGQPRKAALGFIFATALMDILAIGIIIPVLPQLVQHFTGDTARAAQWVGVFGAVWALMQFVCSPIQGALSDRFGRRPVLLTSIFGLGCDYVLMGLAPNLWWLLVGRIISGMTAASFSTANAYIADITPPEKRAQSFGLMGMAFGIGFVCGPALGGVLGHYGTRLPFVAAAVLAFANWLYGYFILPESLPKERRAPFTLANANPLGSLRLLRSHPQLPMIAGSLFLYFLAFQALTSTFVLYSLYRYGWGTGLVGLFLAGVGIANIPVQVWLIRPFVARFGERGALYTGLIFGGLGFAVYASAPTGWLFMAGLPLYALTGLIQPGAQGLMTRRVGPSEQGRLQGANSALMALAGLIGPILFTEVFAWSIRGVHAWKAPGLAFYMSAALMAGAVLLATRIPRLQPAET